MIWASTAVRASLILIGILSGEAQAGGDSALPAVKQIMEAFRRTPLVALGEIHGVQDQFPFWQSLIHNPVFRQQVDDVVVEFGNARYQEVADAFVLDKRAVTLAELRQVWRNTTQSAFNTWDAPMYEAFFRSVRALNQTRQPGEKPVRVLLGDPPIDWQAVKTLQDYGRFKDRDGFYASIVEQQVLAKGHKALLMAGIWHTLRYSAGNGLHGTAIDEIESKHPGKITVLMPFFGFPASLAAAEKQVLSASAQGSNVLWTKGTWLGRLPAEVVLNGPPEAPMNMGSGFGSRTLETVVNGLLVLGDPRNFKESFANPNLFRDPVYAAELLRRKKLFGVENDPRMSMDALLNPPQNTNYWK